MRKGSKTARVAHRTFCNDECEQEAMRPLGCSLPEIFRTDGGREYTGFTSNEELQELHLQLHFQDQHARKLSYVASPKNVSIQYGLQKHQKP